MTRPESAVIIQARTGKIGLRNYLYKIGAKLSLACPCGYRRQTVHHTLLDCPGFNELREDMWSGQWETDLTKLLGDPVLALRVSKFLLATGELLQFRHLNSVADGVDDADNRGSTGGRRLVTRDRASPRMHGPPHTVHKDTVTPAIAGNNDQVPCTGDRRRQRPSEGQETERGFKF